MDNDLREKIRAKVRTLAQSRGVPVNGLTDDVLLIDAGYLDSAGVVELVVWLEMLFDTELDFGELTRANFGTIDLIMQFMAERRGG